MPWFMVDDAITTDEKVLELDPDVRAEAIGTWTLCGAWSSQRLKDGNVPAGIVRSMGGTERGAEALVAVGMWKRTKTGFKFHNWAKYQRTKAQVVAKREDEAERKRKYREAKAQQKGGNVPQVSQRDRSGVPAASASPIPAHPSPSQPLTTNSPSVGKETSVTREDSTAPEIQPCGRKHDAARPCRGCAVSIEKAQSEAAREKSKAASSAARRDAALKQEAIDACDMCGDNGRLDNGRTCHHVESVGMPDHLRDALKSTTPTNQPD